MHAKVRLQTLAQGWQWSTCHEHREQGASMEEEGAQKLNEASKGRSRALEERSVRFLLASINCSNQTASYNAVLIVMHSRS